MKNFLFTNNNFKPKLFKSHGHHIIPAYIPKNLNCTSNYFCNFFITIDRVLSRVPFYFAIVVSIASLLLLFFIFLHKKALLVHFVNLDFGYIQAFWPKFPFYFFTYYFNLFFYIVILVHSVFKYFLHLFDEVRCKYIYTKQVESQYLLGITLFIISEVMLFVSFFWAFLHASLAPSIYIGNCWPPLGISTLNAWHIPFLNTSILLTSGITVNWFFFTLKRLSYITFRPIKPLGFYQSTPLKFILFSTLNFFFLTTKI